MAIFGILECESIVQVNDKTRLKAVKSYVSKGDAAISKVQIKPDVADAYIDVTGTSAKDWYLDHQYPANGTKTVSVEITSGTGMAAVVEEFTLDIEVLDASEDLLLSNDNDLVAYEPDIMNWVVAGRASFLREHRTAQKMILEWLDNSRVWRNDGTKLSKLDISYTDDLNQLSTFKALEVIFLGISNKLDDVFLAKSKMYASRAFAVQNRGRIQADLNGDGTQEASENVDMRSFRMYRR